MGDGGSPSGVEGANDNSRPKKLGSSKKKTEYPHAPRHAAGEQNYLARCSPAEIVDWKVNRCVVLGSRFGEGRGGRGRLGA